MKNSRLWIVPVIIFLLSVAVAVTVYFLDLGDGLINYSGILRGFVEGAGALAPAVFILIFIIAVLLLLPTWPLIIVGGVAFGMPWAMVFSLLGDVLGGYITFSISRYLEKGSFGDFLLRRGEKYYKYYRFLDKHGLTTVILLHFTFLIPFSGVSYLLGLTKVKLKDYIAGTFLGSLPGVLFYSYVGFSITELKNSNFIVIALILVFMVVAGIFASRKIFGREKRVD